MGKRLRRHIGKILILELVLLVGLSGVVVLTAHRNLDIDRMQTRAVVTSPVIVRTNMISPVADAGKSVETAANDGIEQAYIQSIEEAVKNLEYVAASTDTDIESSKVYELVQGSYQWDGSVLSKSRGTVTGPNGKETYYNLNMSVIVRMMRSRGVEDEYWVRSDGCKMLGNYVMVAANLDVHPRGSIVKTSVGLGIVCDTGGFAKRNPQQIDVATNW